MVQKGNCENSKEPSFTCICHLFFNTKQEFLDAIEKARDELVSDVKNYTDIKPYSEILEVSMQE